LKIDRDASQTRVALVRIGRVADSEFTAALSIVPPAVSSSSGERADSEHWVHAHTHLNCSRLVVCSLVSSS